MLVLDVADDLLHEILDRDEPLGARIFVEHDGEMRARRAHLGEQIEHAHRFGNVAGLADQRLQIGRRCRARGKDREHVLDVDHAGHIVEIVAIDGQAAVPRLREGRHQIGERDILGHRDDFAARHADVADRALAEVEEVAQHGALDRREIAGGRRLALALLDHLLDLVAERRLALVAEQQPAQTAPQAAAMLATSILGHEVLRRSLLGSCLGEAPDEQKAKFRNPDQARTIAPQSSSIG